MKARSTRWFIAVMGIILKTMFKSVKSGDLMWSVALVTDRR